MPEGYLTDLAAHPNREILNPQSNIWGFFPPNTGDRHFTQVAPPDGIVREPAIDAAALGNWIYMDRGRVNVIVKLSSPAFSDFETSYHGDGSAVKSFSERLPVDLAIRIAHTNDTHRRLLVPPLGQNVHIKSRLGEL